VKLYYHHDRLGSTGYLTDNVSGKVASFVSYDDWGAPAMKPILRLGERELELVTEYTGHMYDPLLGVYYARARMYGADDRRFMAVDPVKGDIKNPSTMVRYVYVLNNPVLMYDPTGEWAVGDSKYSYEVQLQLLSLTIAYEKYSQIDTIKTIIADQARNIRETSPLKDKPLPISDRLDTLISLRGQLSEADLYSALSSFRITFSGSGLAFHNYSLHVGLSNENLVNIVDSSGKTYAGGNQAWLTAFQNQTGCGSVSVINMVFYYYHKLVCGNTNTTISQDDFIKKYSEYFGNLFTKNISMIAFSSKYMSLVLGNVYRETGVMLTPTQTNATSTDSKTAIGMIAKALMGDNPVALQNLSNSSAEVTSWHWVTITALDISPFDIENSKVTFSTWGKINSYTFSNVWQPGAYITFFE
jgi:RHS repeat-associated protein